MDRYNPCANGANCSNAPKSSGFRRTSLAVNGAASGKLAMKLGQYMNGNEVEMYFVARPMSYDLATALCPQPNTAARMSNAP